MELKIGIDPGLNGAIAAIAGRELIALHDMPTVEVNNKRRVDTGELAHLLRWISLEYTTVSVYIESVHSMPRQGVASTFAFGRSLGAVEGVVGSLELSSTYVLPKVWKARAGLIGQPKDAARGAALELFPYAELSRKKDVDRADAILIAWHGGSLH